MKKAFKYSFLTIATSSSLLVMGSVQAQNAWVPVYGNTQGGGAMAIGQESFAGGSATGIINSIAIGTGATAGAEPTAAQAAAGAVQSQYASIAIGRNSLSNADNSVAFGRDSKVNFGATSSIAIGYNSGIASNMSQSVALGNNAEVRATSAVAIGAGSQANEANTVSIGSSTQQRKLVNVAVGTRDTDAVNVGQLRQNYTQASNILGDGDFITSTVGDDGNGNPTVTISASQSLKNAVAGNFNNGLTIAADENHGEITIKQGENVSMGGNRIQNVGTPRNPGDAVNKAYVDRETSSLRSTIHDMDKDLRAGIAMAIATAGLPQAYMPGKSVVALAGGTYHGQGGFALGLSHATDNRSWVFKGSASVDTRGNFGGSLGAGYQF